MSTPAMKGPVVRVADLEPFDLSPARRCVSRAAIFKPAAMVDRVEVAGGT